MPTPTYDLIEEKVLSTSPSSVTFSSIPGTYKDLVLEWVGNISGTADVHMQFNGDTGSNYSRTYVTGDGTNPSSGRASNQTLFQFAYRGTTIATTIAQIQSYANTNVNKTILSRDSGTQLNVTAYVGLWRSTSAITSILIAPTSGTITSGSVFRLWGVSG